MKPFALLALLCGCDATLSFEEGFDAATDAPVEVEVEVDAGGCETSGCPLESLHCDPATGRCEECVVDADCPFPQFTRCGSDHKCWGCLEEYDCYEGFTCITSVRRCAFSCTTKEQCRPGSLCDTTRSICISCLSNANCFDPGRRHCQTATGRCEECLADKDCPSTRPRCNPATFRCGACLTTADCIAPKLCDPSRHICVTP
jgi:hypothetical protein